MLDKDKDYLNSWTKKNERDNKGNRYILLFNWTVLWVEFSPGNTMYTT